MNGRFTFSDDSHGVSEVACAYDKLEGYLHEHGISKITIFERNIETEDDRFPGIGTRDIDVEEVFKQTFWTGPSKAI